MLSVFISPQRFSDSNVQPAEAPASVPLPRHPTYLPVKAAVLYWSHQGTAGG
jgi:hypothetical protein